MTFDINNLDLDNTLNNIGNINTGDPPAMMPASETNLLITELSKKLSCSQETAFVGTCLICQRGGTAKRAQGNIFVVIDGIRFELNLIRQVMNDNKIKSTLRQFARTHADKIFNISYRFGVEGDLAKKISRRYPSLDQLEKTWLSNFQMDNPNCPENVKNILMEHYEYLFPGKGQS